MNRNNLCKIVFFETAILWFISVTVGLLAGMGLSKLAELGFRKMIDVEASYSFTVSFESVVFTAVVYSVIFFLIFINAVRRVRFARAINLINSEKAGEKPPTDKRHSLLINQCAAITKGTS